MLVGVTPAERIQIALRQCYTASAEVAALHVLLRDDSDPMTETALLRAIQNAAVRRAKAGDDLHQAVADASDPRKPPHWSLRAHRWRHEPQGVCCDD